MSAPVADREATARSGSPSQGNARLSQHRRAKRPLPATRREADELFAPRARIAPAGASRLARLNALGLLELRTTPGPPLTQGEAHAAILDALYPVGAEPHRQADS